MLLVNKCAWSLLTLRAINDYRVLYQRSLEVGPNSNIKHTILLYDEDFRIFMQAIFKELDTINKNYLLWSTGRVKWTYYS